MSLALRSPCMPSTPNTLLVNPTIASRGNARFPLAPLNLANWLVCLRLPQVSGI